MVIPNCAFSTREYLLDNGERSICASDQAECQRNPIA
jgi:hypothetical protein